MSFYDFLGATAILLCVIFLGFQPQRDKEAEALTLVQENCYDGLVYVHFKHGNDNWATVKVDKQLGIPLQCSTKENK
jgi:hypothetical protein